MWGFILFKDMAHLQCQSLGRAHIWSSAPLFDNNILYYYQSFLIFKRQCITIPKFPIYPLACPLPSTTGINEALVRDPRIAEKNPSKKKPVVMTMNATQQTWEGALSRTYPCTPSQSSKSSDLFQFWFRTKNEAITRRSWRQLERASVGVTWGVLWTSTVERNGILN